MFSPLAPYLRLLAAWFKSEEKKFAYLGVFVIAAFSFLIVYLNVWFTEWNKDFFDALEKKNGSLFLRQAFIAIPLFIAMGTSFSVSGFFNSYYRFRWRQWLTKNLENDWLSLKNYYLLPHRSDKVDNPDQRIAVDSSLITGETVYILSSTFESLLNLGTFSILLWGLSNHVILPFGKNNLHFPGLLVYLAILYGAMGVFFTFRIGRPLIGLNRLNEKIEADYRYRLMRVYERREEIAIYCGEAVEKKELRGAFAKIKENYIDILKRDIYVNFFQNFYGQIETFIPLFLIGPAYFSGFISLGILMQIRSMFSQTTKSLLRISYQVDSIYHWIASTKRILDFQDKMEKTPHFAHLSAPPSKDIIIKDFILMNQKKELLWHVPDITVKKGERKILMAPSGRGKTSLLRAMKGIGHHRIPQDKVFVPENTLFTPQRPYMPLGTLRQCLIYPLLEAHDAELVSLMEACQLKHLAPFLDIVDDYQNKLSLGEQQRINFVRILLQRPQWIIMDEPTSSLNDELADTCIHLLLKKLPKSGIFIISHKSLKGFEIITAT